MEIAYAAAGWLVRRAGLLNLALLGLAGVGLGSLAYGFAYVTRPAFLWTFLTLMAAGLGAGWLLAGRRMPAWAAALLAAAAGSLLLGLWVGRMAQPLLALGFAAGRWLVQALSAHPWRAPAAAEPDWLPVRQAWSELARLGLSLALRSRAWLLAQVDGKTFFDPLAVLLVCGLAVWLLSAWAAWWVRRRRNLLGLAPAGALLALLLVYNSAPYNPIIVWSGAALLLQGLGGYLACQKRWQASRAEQADIHAEWSLAAVALVLVCLTAALILPNISLQKINDRLSDLLAAENRLPRSAGAPAGFPAPGGSGPPLEIPLSLTQATGLPNIHLLGSGPELSQQVVLWITVEEESPLPPAEPLATGGQPAEGGLYRWRSLTYERYTGSGWASFPAWVRQAPARESLAPNQPVESQAPLERLLQHVEPVSPTGGMLFSAGEPLTATVDSLAALRSTGEIFGVQVEAAEYRVVSRRPRPTVQQMQAAGTDYPEWVQASYLALPDSLPSRLRELALDLTAPQPTPYDQAVAIETYLRSLPYSLDVPAPPLGRDLVDYYLFDLRQGYCDYAASAMVVLARAAGLPARLAVGYAAGTFSPQEGRFRVSAADAHAWAEVYFPGIGWAEFEPTGGLPPVSRPAAGLPAAPAPPADHGLPAAGAGWGISLWRLAGALGIALLAALALLYLALQADLWRLRAAAPPAAIETIFRRLHRLGARLAGARRASLTPHEHALRLHQNMQAALPQGMRRRFAAAGRLLETLAGLYSRSLFSRQPPDRLAQSQAVDAWTTLRPQLWLAAFWKLLKSRFRL